jgi:hypothetical protein
VVKGQALPEWGGHRVQSGVCSSHRQNRQKQKKGTVTLSIRKIPNPYFLVLGQLTIKITTISQHTLSDRFLWPLGICPHLEEMLKIKTTKIKLKEIKTKIKQ